MTTPHRTSPSRRFAALVGLVLSMWLFTDPVGAQSPTANDEVERSQDPELGEGKFFEKTPDGIVERDPTSPEAQGRATQVAGVQVVRPAGRTVTSRAPALATTGADTTDALLWLGGTALGLGSALVAVARRRPAASS